MADINWSLEGTASKGTWSGATETNDVSTINDDDEGTYHQGAKAGGGSGGMSFEDIVTFTESANSITSVELVSVAGGSNGGLQQVDIYLYYSGAYNLVYTVWDGPDATTWTIRTDTQAGSWSNVTAIKVYMQGAYLNGACSGQVYELRAWGPSNTSSSPSISPSISPSSSYSPSISPSVSSSVSPSPSYSPSVSPSILPAK